MEPKGNGDNWHYGATTNWLFASATMTLLPSSAFTVHLQLINLSSGKRLSTSKDLTGVVFREGDAVYGRRLIKVMIGVIFGYDKPVVWHIRHSGWDDWIRPTAVMGIFSSSLG